MPVSEIMKRILNLDQYLTPGVFEKAEQKLIKLQDA